VGIDPAPCVDAPLSADCQVFRTTSDDFFAEHDLRQVLGGRSLDLAFIDGMHHFEFALRDFMNLEKFAGPDTTVLAHDCYPVDEASASREETRPIWSGDVWKLVLCLKEQRPDLKIAVVDVPPTGLGVISGCDPGSRVLEERYEEIVEHYSQVPYSRLDEDKAGTLNRVDDEWGSVAALLPPKPFRSFPVAPLKVRRTLGAVSLSARRRASKLLHSV